jgi:hypothetical protein
MKKLLRNWGFPAGLLTLWALAAAYTLHALVGVQPTLQSTEVPVPVMAGPPVAIDAPSPAHAS